jgi:hypothetical protein
MLSCKIQTHNSHNFVFLPFRLFRGVLSRSLCQTTLLRLFGKEHNQVVVFYAKNKYS